MELNTFIRLANEAERDRLCTMTKTTLGYLRKIASARGASAFKAWQIEQATQTMSKGHQLLRTVPGSTLCDETKYESFLQQIQGAA